MQYVAEAKNVRISPRKMRLVVDGVRKMPIDKAIATLSIASQRASDPIKKALESAIANAVHNGQVKKEELYIFEMFVNEGTSYKRFHYAGRGRTRPYKKRSSHLKVILGVKDVIANPLTEIEEGKKDEKPMKTIKKRETKKGEKQVSK
ncbi:MAG TPA: 50S ribosomal protein L22 [Candidatus Levybacteria bacterium]|nr:50S ribosomal protein L22 [Candidatus Levybacteria bacterium]